MPEMLTFEIENLDEFQEKLSKMARATGSQAVVRALTSGAQIVSNDAKRKAPYRTGNLRRSIHIEPSGAGEPPATYIGTDVEYARRVEYGFIGPDKLGRVYHQPARPYLRPALEENRTKVNEEVGAALAILLSKAAQ